MDLPQTDRAQTDRAQTDRAQTDRAQTEPPHTDRSSNGRPDRPRGDPLLAVWPRIDRRRAVGPIAVDDPSPTFRRGLTGLLREAGLHPVEPHDLLTWSTGASHRSAVVTIDGAAPLRLIQELVHRQPDFVLIALLPTLEGDTAATALRAGAATVAHRDEVTDRLVCIIEHALAGDALLPIDLARLLAHTPPVDQADQVGLTPDEVRWIGRLARNASVATVAAEAGVSERTMYRRLDQVFRRIGVNNRIEAIAWATSNHYLDV